MLKKPLTPTQNRLFFFTVVAVFSLVIVFNLFYMQVVLGNDYLFKSRNIYAAYEVDRAQRGIIYDRNGIQLVENVPRYRIYINKIPSNEESLKKTIDSLSVLFSKDVNSLYKSEFEKVKDYQNINDVKIFKNVEFAPYIFKIEANPENFPEIKVEKYMMRRYLYPELISHIVGYTGEITPDDYATGNYQYGDEIGKYGIEQGYDDILRGQNGLIRSDFYGASNQKVSSDAIQKINGKDIYLTIDIKYQKKLYDLIQDALKNPNFSETKSFGAVVEDVKTGEILAMASYPTFDSNKFVGGISDDDYKIYLEDQGKPLSNKATQYSQSPGSTFKLLTDLTALTNNAVTANTKFEANGTWDFGGVIFQDAGRKRYGDIDMTQALCVSSNIYHMKTALALDEKTNGQGSEAIDKYFKQIGLDKSSGLNIGTESVGFFPTKETKAAQGEPWFTGFLLNSSIGQGEVRLSPIAEAKMISTIASRGNVLQQKIIKDEKGPNLTTTLSDVPSSVYTDIQKGMRCATDLNNTYLHKNSADYPNIAIKTGSAETGQIFKGQEVVHGWEVSYGPVEDPQIAMSIFMENAAGGWKGGFISRDFYKYYTELNP